MRSLNRYIFLALILVLTYFYYNYEKNRKYNIDKEPWIFREIFRVNMNVMSKIDRVFEKMQYEPIVKYANATSRFLRMPEARISVCYTEWGVVWRVLFGAKLGPNFFRKAHDDEMIRYFGTDHIKKALDLDKNMTGETFIFVKKDPLERAIDEYIQTCIEGRHPCFGCGYDFVCHLQKVHLHLKIVGADNSTMHPDYVRYIPLNWFCEMKTMKDRFIILDDTIVKESIYEKQYSFLDESERNEMGGVNLTNSIRTKNLLFDMVTTNRQIMDLFLATYYWDYVIFNYTIPELKAY